MRSQKQSGAPAEKYKRNRTRRRGERERCAHNFIVFDAPLHARTRCALNTNTLNIHTYVRYIYICIRKHTSRECMLCTLCIADATDAVCLVCPRGAFAVVSGWIWLKECAFCNEFAGGCMSRNIVEPKCRTCRALIFFLSPNSKCINIPN